MKTLSAMAKNLSLSSGSPLCGSPITFAVTAETLSGEVAFHRLVFTVVAKLFGSGDIREFSLSSPVDNGERIEIDVSSCLRSVADSYVYSPTPPPTYPIITYSVKVADEYMQNGEVHSDVAMVESSGHKALFGAYSDYERLLAGSSKLAQHFSRKPSYGEVVAVGETMVCPQSFLSAVSEAGISVGPTSNVVSIVSAGLQVINGRNVYAIEAKPKDERHQFRFVNGLGCLESISVCSLREVDINVTKDTYLTSVGETFGNFSRTIVAKQNDREKWKLSTGPLDRLWEQWFAHEFLMTKHCWTLIGSTWIYCNIVPEDTITLTSPTQVAMREIQFTVELDLNGSPFLAV